MELEDIPFKGAKVITCVPIEQNNFIAGSTPVKTTIDILHKVSFFGTYCKVNIRAKYRFMMFSSKKYY